MKEVGGRTRKKGWKVIEGRRGGEVFGEKYLDSERCSFGEKEHC